MNEQQQAAVEAEGVVFVSAGAGTGKTAVLVERFARAVCERGLDVDSILVITYTEKAAGELRTRIRARLVELGRADLARELDGAWISTIHGLCHRLLRAHPFAAGVDPRFRVLDDSQARVLQGEAFAAALEELCAPQGPPGSAKHLLGKGGERERTGLLSTYGARSLRRMLTGVYETLRAAGRDLELALEQGPPLAGLLDELREAARCLAEDGDATVRQQQAAARTLALLDRRTTADLLLDLSDVRARGERAATYEEARRAVEQSALDELAVRDRDLLQELLDGFARHYAAAKERESALDFEDLQLGARDLLRAHEEVRRAEAWRFRAIMVDEFQDTNRLQCELVDLLAEGGAEDVFFVGDEFQSIYGFRHADVHVFRERRSQAPSVHSLTRNYRSRPEVLAAINHLFGADFGDEFQPLMASGEFPDPVFGTPVELLVTDKASYAGSGLHWRRAEAKAVARRVRELVDGGEASPGEIVLLFAAGTDAEWFEEELRELGLPTYRATGRGYFGQQQVVDLLAYLRLLHNRYDDEALVTVLASPLVGVSNDALVLIRKAAPRRPLFTGIEKGFPADLPARDAQRCRAFLQRYERLAAASSRLSLERLCEQILAEHDYDLAVLAKWDGRRRYANLRKLARLARSYEELRGADLEGFVRFVREQEAVGAKELEAAAEEEGADAVRLLTIHAAKGLEFKVVVVADAGRDRATPGADEILALPDGRFGFRVADPATGRRRPAFGYGRVKEESEREAEAERRRLYYVAMTRAVDRLIVSGSVELERAGDARTPIGWVLSRLDADELADAAADTLELEREGARILVRVDRHPPAADDAPAPPVTEPAEAGQLALFDPAAPLAVARPVPPLPALVDVPAPPLHQVRRLSFTALSTFDTCSYRYFAERVAGMRPREGRAPGETGVGATEIGSIVHGLLEHMDLRAPAVPDVVDGRLGEEERDRVRAFLAAYCGSELASRLAALEGVVQEQRFTFEHDGVLLRGFLDVFHRDGPRALVVDYKTNALGERSPEEVVQEGYGLQRLVYALACFRAGADEVEVVYQFLEQPDALVTAPYRRADLPLLEAGLSEAIARIRAGEFRPTPSDFACAGCPALDVVCAGPRLRTAAPTELAATA